MCVPGNLAGLLQLFATIALENGTECFSVFSNPNTDYTHNANNRTVEAEYTARLLLK